ncbi:MAG: aromatic aminobenezylarsenical efflux permease ArsG family transporter [Patescibacteria group bacterium]|nr:aromatic aminobenezylarsenical efflux permease ArsG family transporter [Patescibacteria group bacterium]
MSEFVIGIGTALWLGILTSISPCPLATNIAAISYIARKVGNSRQVFLTGLLYTVGRTLAYLVLALVLVGSVLSVPEISLFLQKYMHLVLGPILVVVGMFLMGLIEFDLGGGGMGAGLQKRVDAMGIWGSLLLGVVFALTFCPTSAALFFGSLVPLSLAVNSTVTLPVVYGIGTAVPVMVFAVLLATSAQSVGKAYNVLAKVEWFARMATGGVFILVGIYFSLKHVFRVI